MNDARRTPADGFVLHLRLSFLLFTAASGVLFWSVSAAPYGMDETGAGRGLVAIVAIFLWVVGLICTLAFAVVARRSEMSKKSAVTWSSFFWMLAIVYLTLVLIDTLPALRGGVLTANERSAYGGLRTLTTAEADFQANDRDENKVNDFWVGDVSMFYCLKPPGSGVALKLIELSVAAADPAALRSPDGKQRPIEEFAAHAPKFGYYYRAIPNYADATGKAAPYDLGGGRNPMRFGFCAYANSRSAGKRTFIVNEGDVVYWKDLNGAPVETFPADLVKDGWMKAE